jgi:hypothetical protein
MEKIPSISFLVLVIAVLAGVGATAAPKSDLWPRWQAHDPASILKIDHGDWDRWLKSSVRTDEQGVNRIAFGRIKGQSRAVLDGYITRLSGLTISRYNRAEQMAYWINLYNALTVRLIRRHYPVEKITGINISPGLFSSGPWGAKIARVEGKRLSLDDIEHRILRPIWRDPRIHYVVNCAAVGCPNLAREAYTGDKIDSQLTRAARAYVNNWRGVSVQNGKLTVSKIYDWYRDDFGGSVMGVLAHLTKYAKPELVKKLRRLAEISTYQYSWDLNDDPV